MRKLRALRFQARLGGTFDKDVLSALQNNPTLNAVSSERIRDEFVKSIKSAKNPQKYMELNDKIGFTKLILPNLKVNKPYLNDNDYILFLASLLRNNPISFLSKQLNTLNYTNDERVNIVFLVSLQQFKSESIFDYKKLQQKTTLSDEQIKKFGKLIGKDMSKFVNFKLSVGGNDVPNDITGANIGIWIKNKEQENFLREHMEKNKFISEVFKEEIQMLNEGKVLRVFDWDDTLGKSTSYIYVKHKDGKETKLDPAEYAVYNEKPGDTYDFRDFNRMLNNPKIIEKNFKLLQRMLDNPQKKVTILTARKLAFPVRKYLKDTFGMDVYVVALGSNNPQDKADWIEKHIKKGYTDIAFMDDSRKNIQAVDALKSKYPNIRIKTHLVKEHIEEEVQNYLNKLIH